MRVVVQAFTGFQKDPAGIPNVAAMRFTG